jgi:hypothetical protein
MSTASPQDVAYATIGAGDWLCWGIVTTFPNAGVSFSFLEAWVGLQSNTEPGNVTSGDQFLSAAFTAGSIQKMFTGTKRFSVASSTNLFLGTENVNTGGNATAGDVICTRAD